MALDGVRQTPVETRAHCGVVFAELRNDPLLTFLHDEKSRAAPKHECHGTDQAQANARTFGVGIEAWGTALVSRTATTAIATKQA